MSYYLLITLLCATVTGLIGLLLTLWPYKPLLSKVIRWNANRLHSFAALPQHASRSEPTFERSSLSALKPVYDTPALLEGGKLDHRIFSILYLMAPIDQPYVGYVLWQALLSQQLRYGPMQIFHAYEQDKTEGHILFSVANALEPGYFDSDHIETITTPGLCLFMNHSALLKPLKTFQHMLKAGKRLEHLLGGTLSDNQRKPLSEETLQMYQSELFRLSDVSDHETE